MEEEENQKGKQVEEDSNEDYPFYDIENPKLEVGMTFASPQSFRDAVKYVNILQGCNLTFFKNTSERVTARCKELNCEYRVHASWVSNECIFQIKTMQTNHRCSRTVNNKQATSYLHLVSKALFGQNKR